MLPVSPADLCRASVTSCTKRGNPFGYLSENSTLKSKRFSRENGWSRQSCVTWTLHWTRLRIQWEIRGVACEVGLHRAHPVLSPAARPPSSAHTPKPYPSTLRVVALRPGWPWSPASTTGQGRACHDSHRGAWGTCEMNGRGGGQGT